jgi:hypothetical protein
VSAQRICDRPDVGSRADAEVEPHLHAGIRDDFERLHTRAPHRHLHLDAPTRKLVRALPVDLHGRGSRDRQLDLTPEARESPFQLVLGRGLQPLGDLPLRISRRGPRREVDIRHVALVEPHEA